MLTMDAEPGLVENTTGTLIGAGAASVVPVLRGALDKLWGIAVIDLGNAVAALPLSVALTLGIFLLAEFFFYLWFKRQLRLAQEPVPPPVIAMAERDRILAKILRHAQEYGVWRQLQGWFLNESRTACHGPHEIGRSNLMDLMAWAFFFKHIQELQPEEVVWIEGTVRRVEEEFNLTIAEGCTGVKCVKHTLDPVVAYHRPLMFYFFVFFVKRCHGSFLRFRGFRRLTMRTASGAVVHYWHRRAPESELGEFERAEEPLVFFHGVGMGLVMYITLLFRLQASEQFLFLMPWVSMNPFADIPTVEAYTEAVVAALEKHGRRRVQMVGHSFGSLPVAWIVRRYPEMVSRCVLLDPVCILLNLPDVCVNFLYKRPRSWIGRIVRYFGSRELGIAKCLHRRLFWNESVLFPEQLPEGSTIVLGERDHVLPARDIYTSAQALASDHVQTIMLDSIDHGVFLFHPKSLERVVDCINGVSPKSV